jgi:hypothetical protein
MKSIAALSSTLTAALGAVDLRTHQLVFRGAGTAVIGGPESDAGKIRDAVEKMVAAFPK